jgi:hypothetical protein
MPRTEARAVLDCLWIICVGMMIVGNLALDARRLKLAVAPVLGSGLAAGLDVVLTMGDVLWEATPIKVCPT